MQDCFSFACCSKPDHFKMVFVVFQRGIGLFELFWRICDSRVAKLQFLELVRFWWLLKTMFLL